MSGFRSTTTPSRYAVRALTVIRGGFLQRGAIWHFISSSEVIPMMPFDILSCSWPRPVEESAAVWQSTPDWNAPQMRSLPQLQQRTIGGDVLWAIDWSHEFSRGLRFHSPRRSGEMRGFHVVFQLRMHDSGKLVFWDDDGCIVRRAGKIVHEDRECHALTRHELRVRAGDCLEIAHWQYHGEWVWAGRLETDDNNAATLECFSPYLPKIQKALREPNGPPLKMYFGGHTPARSLLSMYSMILNGYQPAAIHLYGEYQWRDDVRRLLAALMPFARVVPTGEVSEQLNALNPLLTQSALSNWQVMKICIGLFCPPHEYCFMDDDIFILKPVTDALTASKDNDLVYAPDADYSREYLAIWDAHAKSVRLPTGNINTGLYWLRNRHQPAEIAARLLSRPASHAPAWLWEQGFMAVEYAEDSAFALSAKRYFYPYFDGLPEGPAGYDYGANPCDFTSLHFGGLASKPACAEARMLAPLLLNRRRGRSA
jgi:hypothetical protein